MSLSELVKRTFARDELHEQDISMYQDFVHVPANTDTSTATSIVIDQNQSGSDVISNLLDSYLLVNWHLKFETGAVGTLHQHFHSQASYVESGVFELIIGDEKKVLNAGDGYYVPPHILHGAFCLEAGVLIDSFSPHREDSGRLNFKP